MRSDFSPNPSQLFFRKIVVRFMTTCFLVFCPLSAIAVTQESHAWNDKKSETLSQFVDALAEQKDFNGAILLAEDGKVVFEKYAGFANINDKSDLGQRSSFRLASVSKQFTAMGIMILKEQGKLDFDDDITKHLPTLPYKGVTIRHLLHHNGGLADYTRWFSLNWDIKNAVKGRKMAFNKDLVEQFSKAKPKIQFAPGEKHKYSNTGYVLLGQIIETASDMPIRRFFQEQVFTPLGMTDTQAFSPGNDFNVAERVFGFELLADGISHEDNDWSFMNGMIGDGGIYASARDLVKWDQAWYGEKLVSQATIQEAYTSGKTSDGMKTNYGFGWVVIAGREGNTRIVTHDGGWVGFATHIFRDLDNRRTTIILTNNSDQGFGIVKNAIRKIAKGQQVEIPRANIAYELASVIESEGVESAVARFKEIKQSEADNFLITKKLLTNLADFYREKGKRKTADQIESLISPGGDFKVTKELLENLVGKYNLSDDFAIQISRRGIRLYAQATGQGELKLKPVSENLFEVVGVDAEISFSLKGSEAVSLTLHQGGANQVAKKSD